VVVVGREGREGRGGGDGDGVLVGFDLLQTPTEEGEGGEEVGGGGGGGGGEGGMCGGGSTYARAELGAEGWWGCFAARDAAVQQS